MWEKIVRWFIKYAWPLIKQFLLRVLAEVFEWLFNLLKKFLGRWGNKQATDADIKAQEADNKANVSTSAEELERYVVEARVWREVAEKLRVDNEDLQQKLGEIQKKASAQVEDKVNKMTVDKIFEVSKKDLSLKQNIRPLSLPLPENDI